MSFNFQHFMITPPQWQPGSFHFLDEGVHEKTLALHDYWKSKLDGKSMPLRSSIDPIEIPSLLPNMVIVDVEQGEKFKFKVRLYGTRIAEISGEDRTGKYVEDFSQHSPEITKNSVVERWRSACNFVCEHRTPCFTLAERVYPPAVQFMAHLALLPLTKDGESVDQILGLGTYLPNQTAPVLQ